MESDEPPSASLPHNVFASLCNRLSIKPLCASVFSSEDRDSQVLPHGWVVVRIM